MKHKDIGLVIFSSLIGYFCMTSSPILSTTALIVPILWILASTRVSAFFVMLSYHLAISRGVILGAPVFLSETHTLPDAFLLWIFMSIGIALPFFIFWSQDKHKKIIALFAAFLFAYVIPPIALIGVVNPLMMSGSVFPSFGWWGLLIMLLIYFSCVISSRIAWISILTLVFLPIIGIGGLKNISPPNEFLTIDTSFGRMGSGSFNFSSDYERVQMVFRQLYKMDIQNHPAKYIVLPETIAGRLNNVGIELWQREIKRLIRDDQKVIFGGEIPTNSGRKYDNMMLLLDGNKITTIPQRIPVPYSMYRPFSDTGANLHLLENGILELDGKKITVIICYEAFLSLPYMLSFMQKTDLILWAGNQWWCKDTSLPMIQERCVSLWGQLFNIPVIFVRNR